MARDERLKKVQGVGADFLETARARAEEFLRELSRAGADTQGRTQGAIDDLVEGGRKGTEQLVGVIRREITNQLSLLGLATKEDLVDLERRLSGGARSGSPAARTAAKKAPAKKATNVSKTAAGTTAATKSAARKAPAKKTPAKKTAG